MTIPYPLRATRIAIEFNPFGFWSPSFNRRELTEAAKADGELIWWVRFAWFQLSYSRWR